jgi:D-alanyl-D-alanine carboxypeptidase/D-alanyl-D-alanine-endopeptidase (penicillin-binding protein 4)
MGLVRSDLAATGLPLAGLVTVDGSGLDRSDRATCRLLLAVLEHAPQRAWLARGLPVAAQDGTLARHFHGSVAAGRLRAKTGSLTGVAGLTGLAATVRGETLAFSLLVNGLPHDALGVYVYEKVGGILVRYPDVPTAARLAVPWT